MKHCTTCGKEIQDQAVVCPNCGCATNTEISNVDDKANIGLVILSVIIPLVGIILWPVKHKKTPKAALTYGLTGIIAWVVYALLSMLAGGF